MPLPANPRSTSPQPSLRPVPSPGSAGPAVAVALQSDASTGDEGEIENESATPPPDLSSPIDDGPAHARGARDAAFPPSPTYRKSVPGPGLGGYWG